ncbi:bifunctional DedA family/phosphatase PAP2 family protein [Vreelandella subterranea]|uniref:bifunctional DedA family/phosphatase PAP2 family protein n=1 Tax=Vreelandella subterranea TaxID=416874 RepID=UPI000B862CC2|nr:bifunctional DedA family/phosphatase PAP2 family protein [Halomonas subterranea]
MSIADTLLSFSLAPALLLLLLLGISLLESLALIGLLVPGVVLITALASIAGHQMVALPWLIGAAFTGAVLGDGLSYFLGYRHRDTVITRWPLSQHPEWINRGARFFERYGIYSVFIGRFVGPVRPIIPLIAGMMHMPSRTFLLANVASAALWAPAYVLPGFLLGHTWQQRLNLPTNVEMAVLMITASIVVLAIMFSWGRAQVGRHGRVYLAIARIARRIPAMRRPWLAMSRSGEVPLASLFLCILALTATSAWTLLILHHPEPLLIDLQAQRLFAWLNTDWLTTTSLLLAEAGDKAGIMAFVTPWAIWLLWVRRLDLLIHGALALGSIGALNALGKAVFARARPDTPDYLIGSFSYPSAHTSTWVVIGGMLAAFVASQLPRQRRVWAYWLAIATVIPMALSRLVIDVHWLSDLVGGALLGLVVCAMVQINWQRRYRAPLPSLPWVSLLLGSLLFVSLRVALFPPV